MSYVIIKRDITKKTLYNKTQNNPNRKSIQEKKGPGCSKTFIHDGESYQLMTINAVHLKHAGKMTKFNYMEILQIESVIFQKVTCTSSMCL
jgi:hypothetical protein